MGDIRTTLTLVTQAKAGDGQAFNKLMERYLQRILRIVRARLGSKLREKLESMDVVQNVMVRVVKSFNKFEVKDESAFLHWVSKLVQNEIRDLADYHHAKKRDLTKEIDEKASEVSQGKMTEQLPETTIYTPSVIVRLKQEVKELEKAMDQLTEKDREVLIMRQYEGMAFKDIGEELKIGAEAARKQYARAMDRLTDLMPTEGV